MKFGLPPSAPDQAGSPQRARAEVIAPLRPGELAPPASTPIEVARVDSARAAVEELAARRLRIARWALVAVFALHLALALVVAAHHEPWRDEADIWLFGRDAPAREWWSFLRHSGHPGLWHLLVAGLARSGLPYASMTFANVAIVSLGIAIFLRFARLPLAVKLVLPLGVLPLYEYGVVARSYGLSFTLSMAACAALAELRARRDARDFIPAGARSHRETRASPGSEMNSARVSTRHVSTGRLSIALGACLALLANTNVHSVILAAGFGLFWILDERAEHTIGERRLSRATLAGLSIAFAGGLAAVAQILPPDDPQMSVARWGTERVMSRALTDAFFPGIGRSAGGVLGLVLLGACVVLAWRRRAPLAFLAWSTVGLFVLFRFVYPPYPRHSGFVWIALTCFLWLERCTEPTSERIHTWRARIAAAFAISSCFSVVEGVRCSLLDLRAPFSASREAAELVNTLDIEGAIVAAHPSTMGEAILPYLRVRELYYPGIDAMGSYLEWDSAYWLGVFVENAVALARTRRAFPEPRPLVFISTSPLEHPEVAGLLLRHRTAIPPVDFKDDEHYFIYASQTIGPRRSK